MVKKPEVNWELWDIFDSFRFTNGKWKGKLWRYWKPKKRLWKRGCEFYMTKKIIAIVITDNNYRGSFVNDLLGQSKRQIKTFVKDLIKKGKARKDIITIEDANDYNIAWLQLGKIVYGYYGEKERVEFTWFVLNAKKSGFIQFIQPVRDNWSEDSGTIIPNHIHTVFSIMWLIGGKNHGKISDTFIY